MESEVGVGSIFWFEVTLQRAGGKVKSAPQVLSASREITFHDLILHLEQVLMSETIELLQNNFEQGSDQNKVNSFNVHRELGNNQALRAWHVSPWRFGKAD